MPKRVSARKIKTHNQYTYEQAADVLDVSVQTVGAGCPGQPKTALDLGLCFKGFSHQTGKQTQTPFGAGSVPLHDL